MYECGVFFFNNNDLSNFGPVQVMLFMTRQGIDASKRTHSQAHKRTDSESRTIAPKTIYQTFFYSIDQMPCILHRVNMVNDHVFQPYVFWRDRPRLASSRRNMNHFGC